MAIRPRPRKGRRLQACGTESPQHHATFFVIPFPAFDPVLVHLGPLAIRWYALAYIVGILLGWVYARALIRNDRLWAGGKAPLTVDLVRRLRAVGDARHHPRRPHRLCAVLQSAALRRAPARNLPALAGRHVVPRRLHRLRRGRHRSSPRAATFPSCRSATSPAPPGRSGCSSAASPISSMANCGAAPTDVPWAMVFPNGGPLPRHPSQLYEAALEGILLFVVPCSVMIRKGALKRPGLIIGSFAVVYALARSASANSSASLTRSSASCGAARRWACCCRCRCFSPASASSSTR